MKRFLSVLALVAFMLVATSAFALEKGDEVDICESEGEYVILPADMECGGELYQGVVTAVQDDAAQVDLGDGNIVTVPTK